MKDAYFCPKTVKVELKDMLYDLLLDRRSVERGYFREEFIREMIDEHISGRWNWQYQLYNLLMLELWHREFIDSHTYEV